MSASTNFSRTIMIGMQYNPTCGLFALTSADLPGLLLAGKDPGKLWSDVPDVVKALYKVGYDMDVEVVMEAMPGAEASPDRRFFPLPPSTLLKVEPLAA